MLPIPKYTVDPSPKSSCLQLFSNITDLLYAALLYLLSYNNILFWSSRNINWEDAIVSVQYKRGPISHLFSYPTKTILKHLILQNVSSPRGDQTLNTAKRCCCSTLQCITTSDWDRVMICMLILNEQAKLWLENRLMNDDLLWGISLPTEWTVWPTWK